MEVDEIDTGCISQIKLLAKNFKSLDEDIQKRIESNKSTKIINIFNYLETKIYNPTFFVQEWPSNLLLHIF